MTVFKYGGAGVSKYRAGKLRETGKSNSRFTELKNLGSSPLSGTTCCVFERKILSLSACLLLEW